MSTDRSNSDQESEACVGSKGNDCVTKLVDLQNEESSIVSALDVKNGAKPVEEVSTFRSVEQGTPDPGSVQRDVIVSEEVQNVQGCENAEDVLNSETMEEASCSEQIEGSVMPGNAEGASLSEEIEGAPGSKSVKAVFSPEKIEKSTVSEQIGVSVVPENMGGASSSDQMEEVPGSKIVEVVLNAEKIDIALGSEQIELSVGALPSGDMEGEGKYKEEVLNSEKIEETSGSEQIEGHVKPENTDGAVHSDEIEKSSNLMKDDLKSEESDHSAAVSCNLSIPESDLKSKTSFSETVNTGSEKPGKQVDSVCSSKSTCSVTPSFEWKVYQNLIGVLSKECKDRSTEERFLLIDDIKLKAEQARVIGEKFCEENNIPFPSRNRFGSLLYNLYKSAKLNEENLKGELKKAAGILKSFVKLPPGYQGGHDPTVGKQVSLKLKKYANKYCNRIQVPPPSDERRAKMITVMLVRNLELCAESFELVLIPYIQNYMKNNKLPPPHLPLEFRNRDLFRKCVDSIMKNVLPRVVKPINEMTDDERRRFFAELDSLSAEMKVVAIKHCHSIKAPFPYMNDFSKICRDLFLAGMLNEKNVKDAIDVYFANEMSKHLTSPQKEFILKDYREQKRLFHISLQTLQNEFVSSIPENVLTKRNYFDLLYREKLMNLFTKEDFLLPGMSVSPSRKPDSPAVDGSLRKKQTKAVKSKLDQNVSQSFQQGEKSRLSKNTSEKRKRRLQDVKWRGRSPCPPSDLNYDFSSFDCGKRCCGTSRRIPHYKKNIGSRLAANKGTDHVRSFNQSSTWNPAIPSCSGTQNMGPICYNSNYTQGQYEEPIQPRWTSENKQLSGRNSNYTRGQYEEPIQSRWTSENKQFSGRNSNYTRGQYEEPIRSKWTSENKQFSGRVTSNPSQSHFYGREKNSDPMGREYQSDLQSDQHMFEEDEFNQEDNFNYGQPLVSESQPNSTRSPTTSSYSMENQVVQFHLQGCSNDERHNVYSNNGNLSGWRSYGYNSRECDPIPSRTISNINHTSKNYTNETGQKRNHDLNERGPSQKRSRYDDELQTNRAVGLRSETNQFERSMGTNNERFTQPMQQEVPRRTVHNQDFTTRTNDTKEQPPIVKRGETCKVGIVHVDYPARKLDSDEANLLRSALLDRIGSQSGVGPRFRDTYDQNGAAVFECEDQLTVSWLWMNSPTIKPWPSARLRPTAIVEPFKEICIQVPKIMAKLTLRALCDRLESQNTGLSTTEWTLKSSEVTSSRNMEFIFGVDELSFNTLKSMNMKLYCGFSRVDVCEIA